MYRQGITGLIIALLMVSAISLVVLGPADDTNSGASSLGIAQSEEFDSTVFRIHIFENGDARWTIEHARTLETEDEVTQFEAFAERLRTEETDAFSNFKVRAEKLTQSGTEKTDREMNATQFERDAFVEELGQTSGVIEMSFVWTNFAQVDDSTVVVADVFGGGWAIVQDQRLTVQAGENVVFDEVAPEPDSMTVTDNLTASESVSWFGERQFADKRPRAVLVPQDHDAGGTETPTETATATTTPTATPSTNGSTGGDVSDGEGSPTGTPDGSPDSNGTDDDGESPPDGQSNTDMMPMLAVVLLVLGLGTGFAWYAGVLSGFTSTETDDPDTAPTPPQTPGVEAQQSPAVPDAELLSDDDRIIQLLEANGGRMKQVDIVEKTDWSKSKVSMLLSEMDQEGQISKLRMGRENIISLSGEEPDAASSPFDSE